MIPLPSRRWLAVAAGFALVALLGLVWTDALAVLMLIDVIWIAAFALDCGLGGPCVASRSDPRGPAGVLGRADVAGGLPVAACGAPYRGRARARGAPGTAWHRHIHAPLKPPRQHGDDRAGVDLPRSPGQRHRGHVVPARARAPGPGVAPGAHRAPVARDGVSQPARGLGAGAAARGLAAAGSRAQERAAPRRRPALRGTPRVGPRRRYPGDRLESDRQAGEADRAAVRGRAAGAGSHHDRCRAAAHRGGGWRAPARGGDRGGAPAGARRGGARRQHRRHGVRRRGPELRAARHAGGVGSGMCWRRSRRRRAGWPSRTTRRRFVRSRFGTAGARSPCSSPT